MHCTEDVRALIHQEIISFLLQNVIERFGQLWHSRYGIKRRLHVINKFYK